MLEPTQFEEPNNGFLQKVRKIANTYDSLLILDEIVTGFRFDLAIILGSSKAGFSSAHKFLQSIAQDPVLNKVH